MSAPAPALLRLSGREVQALNLLATRAQAVRIDLDPPVTLDVESLPNDELELTRGLGEFEHFAAEWGGARFELVFARPALTDWLNARLETLGYVAAEINTLGEQWRDSARALALDWLLGGLERAGRGPARIVSPEQHATAAPGPTPPLPFAFALSVVLHGVGDAPPRAIQGRMGCDSLGLMLMAGLVSALPALPGRLDDGVAQMPLRLAVQLGSTTLGLAQLSALRHGDIVLVSRMLRSPDDVFHIRLNLGSGSATFRARLENGALISLDGSADIMTDMPPSASVTPADAIESLEQMPVRLDFDLGELTLTLAALRALRPGQVLPLEAPISAAVQIRANGALIGHGELAEIDGRCGVVIRALTPPQAIAPQGASSVVDGDDDD